MKHDDSGKVRVLEDHEEILEYLNSGTVKAKIHKNIVTIAEN